jgi:acetolactate synthase-1/2/3 large subunit
VISVNGDGAFGINAMEIDTAVRHGAKAVFVVSNNAAWNIERYDQETNYGGRVVGTTAAPLRLCRHGARARRPRRAGSRTGASCRRRWSAALANAPALSTSYLADRGVVRRAARGWASCPTSSR